MQLVCFAALIGCSVCGEIIPLTLLLSLFLLSPHGCKLLWKTVNWKPCSTTCCFWTRPLFLWNNNNNLGTLPSLHYGRQTDLTEPFFLQTFDPLIPDFLKRRQSIPKGLTFLSNTDLTVLHPAHCTSDVPPIICFKVKFKKQQQPRWSPNWWKSAW